MKIGDECVTWDCKGKCIGDSKREDGETWMTIKCNKCSRGYWHDNMIRNLNEKSEKENKNNETI